MFTEHGVCVPTYMRNTYPGVGSVLRAIIACRPEDSLRPVLSYPSSSLANVPRQTHDYNPSFPPSIVSRSRLFLSPRSEPSPPLSFSPLGSDALNLRSHPYRFSLEGKEKPLVGSSSDPVALLFLLWSRHLPCGLP